MDLEQIHRRVTAVNIDDRLNNTYGDNPCTALRFTDGEETIEVPCDTKRCEHCGPRKQLRMRLQLQEAMGEHCYILRTTNIDKTIARLKKQYQRSGEEWIYQSVGDDYLGYILISNLPINENSNRTTLKDWLDRIIHNWIHGDKRLRRSRIIGTLSLFTHRRRGQRGTSPWKRVSGAKKTRREELEDLIIAEREADMEAMGLDGWIVYQEGDRLRSSIDAWRAK